ncbi:MAG: 4Fe-4S binding protein [Clostridiales bacterium]|jgi:pyruvate ferredoxin oxidoreductase delta subunit|nr:4Fe-4S binding protein [Clostridiales bacterium]
MSKKELKTVPADVGWKDITEGGLIPWAGNAHLFKTGDWRTMKPVWLTDKCKQCRMCFAVCPDSSILLNEDGSTMIGIDYDHCKGCGVCVKTCPFKALDFVPEDK